jgi:hypothetical protein
MSKEGQKTRKTPPRETTSQAVLQENLPPGEDQLLEKGQLGKEDILSKMVEQMGKILELVESDHIL